jgi:hypothetical protein
MAMKKYFLVSILVSVIAGFSSAPAAHGATRTLAITKSDLLEKTEFSLSFSLRGARVVIRRINDDDTIVKADITYNTPRLEMQEPKLLTKSSGNAFTAEFKSGMRALPYTNTTIEEWDIIIGNYDVNTELTLVCGNVSADLNLGGLPLIGFTLKCRQGSVGVDFAAPTTRPVEHITINGHALNLSVSNIGNADFGFFNFTGSGGAADLNFDGLYTAEEHNVQIATTGMIEDITVPSDAGEQVVALPFSLPIVVVPRDKWTRDFRLPFLQRYSTNDYNTQRIKINLGITSIGSFSMVVRDSE